MDENSRHGGGTDGKSASGMSVSGTSASGTSTSGNSADGNSADGGLRGEALRAALEEAGAHRWRIEEDGGIRAVLDTGDFRTGLAVVAEIGELAEAADHHPDVLLTYPRVEVSLISHDVGAVTRRDVDLAAGISRAAATRGVELSDG